LHHELEHLQNAMSDPAQAGDLERILSRFGEVQDEYDHLGGYALEAQAREVLHGLGFEDDTIDGDVGALSGGWKMRVAMARVLLGRPEVLLMDEPTNHLDIESIIWLESFLKTLTGSLLMTSHDRDFMNRIVSKIAEIDGGEITTYSGNYDFYERERAIREANREAAYARQQSMLAKEQRFIERFAAHAAKAAQVQSRVKALEKIEKIELPKKRAVVKFEFRPPPRSGDQVAVLEGVTKRYGTRAVHDGFEPDHPPRRALVRDGKNGAGKSTLLKMVRARWRLTLATSSSGPACRWATSRSNRSICSIRSDDQGAARKRTFQGVDRRAAEPGRSFPVLRRRHGQEDPRALRRREDAAGARTHAAEPAELPGARRADQPSRSRDKEMLLDSLKDFDGTMLFVVARPGVPARAEQPGAGTGGESGTEAQPHAYQGSYIEYVQRTGHEAPGVHS